MTTLRKTPGSVVLIFILLFCIHVPSCLVSANCCDEEDRMNDSCAIRHIIAAPNKSDGVEAYTSLGDYVYSVEISKVNEVPGFTRDISDRTSCDACHVLPITVIVNGTTAVFKRRTNGTEAETVVYDVVREEYSNRFEVPVCDTTLPLALRLLLNCESKTHNDSIHLHHVGTFYSRDRQNYTLVGYYRFKNDSNSELKGWKTRVIAWNDRGTKIGDRVYLDKSGTVSLTGWREKGGKERVISVNEFGHMCFFSRSYDSLEFLPPGEGHKFMPECLPANMLYKCTQSYCYTGFVDEILHSENIFRSKRHVTFFRGRYDYLQETSRNISNGYELTRHMSTTRFSKSTVAAATAIPAPQPMEIYLMDKHNVAILFTFMDPGPQNAGISRHRRINRNTFLLNDGLDSLEVTAMYLNSTELLIFTESECVKYDVQSNNLNHNLTLTRNPNLSANDAKVDAMFDLDGLVFQKSGQFIWEMDDVSSVRPILKHPVHNPNGIVSITHCKYSNEEAKELFTRVNATRNKEYNMLSIGDVQVKVSGNKAVIVMSAWWLIFLLTIFAILYFKHRQVIHVFTSS